MTASDPWPRCVYCGSATGPFVMTAEEGPIALCADCGALVLTKLKALVHIPTSASDPFPRCGFVPRDPATAVLLATWDRPAACPGCIAATEAFSPQFFPDAEGGTISKLTYSHTETAEL